MKMAVCGDVDGNLALVMKLALNCNYEAGHTHQVTRLALRLFDELQPLHELGQRERFYLQCAALLHDIGWIEGQKSHHKVALRIIRKSPVLTFDKRQRRIIGSIARYHRGALPRRSHRHYALLQPSDRRIVAMLSALLRVADGLDRTHEDRVKDLTCKVLPDRVIVAARVDHPALEEKKEAVKKANLFERVFDRKVEIEWKQ